MINHSTFGQKVIDLNKKIIFKEQLPSPFQVLNPYFDNPETIDVMQQFYEKFYSDNQQRNFIIGINPSRHGAGLTGVPFTDTKRLESECGITMKSAYSHEISSVFLYQMIQEFGGVEKFYQKFYINSPFPLAIVKETRSDHFVNANYYDDPILFKSVKNYMIETLKTHISFGLNTEKVIILGKKNARFIQQINQEERLFNEMIILEHPRYIQQYKSKEMQLYIDKYLIELHNF